MYFEASRLCTKKYLFKFSGLCGYYFVIFKVLSLQNKHIGSYIILNYKKYRFGTNFYKKNNNLVLFLKKELLYKTS